MTELKKEYSTIRESGTSSSSVSEPQPSTVGFKRRWESTPGASSVSFSAPQPLTVKFKRRRQSTPGTSSASVHHVTPVT